MCLLTNHIHNIPEKLFKIHKHFIYRSTNKTYNVYFKKWFITKRLNPYLVKVIVFIVIVDIFTNPFYNVGGFLKNVFIKMSTFFL